MKVSLLFFLLLSSILKAQVNNKNTVWCFGDSALIDFTIKSNPTVGNSSVRARGSCASISNNNDSLLFYAQTDHKIPGIYEGACVWNKNHNLMDRGDSLQGGGWYQEITIVPIPSIANKYFLFAVTIGGFPFGLWQSEINMSINNGLGKVVKKNKKICPYQQVDGINAVKHGNGRDWWIFTRRFDKFLNGSNFWDIYLVTDSGVTDSVNQQVGTANVAGLAFTAISKNGKRVAFVNNMNLIEVFDFDRCTGIISNPITIQQQTPFAGDEFTGVAFSANGNVLYVSNYTTTSLIQYDLTAANIGASKFIVYKDTNPNVIYGGLALAPDDKIYHTWWGCTHLGVINNPDSLSKQCNYAPNSFYLGGKHSNMSLPNNPNYELGPDTGSVCDSLGLGVETTPSTENSLFSIVPNPSTGQINLILLNDKTTQPTLNIKIFNYIGDVVYNANFKNVERVTQLKLQHLKAGAYTIMVTLDGTTYKTNKLIIMK